MNYPKTKVYFDGSHFIGIPPEKQPWKQRKKVSNVKLPRLSVKTIDLPSVTCTDGIGFPDETTFPFTVVADEMVTHPKVMHQTIIINVFI